MIAATNRPDMIDPAMCRPGRLDKLLYVDLPNSDERVEIVRTMLRKVPLRVGPDDHLPEGISASEAVEKMVKEDCCGDAVLGFAIQNITGVKLESLHPTFAGEELKDISIDRDRWCVPLLSLHRIAPEQMESLWKWERTRPYNQVFSVSYMPLLHNL